jgi:hypothetical protein
MFAAQTSGYYKWQYHNKLRKKVQSKIEDLRREGYVGWADHLQDVLEFTTTFKQSAFEKGLDGMIAKTPWLGRRASPMPTRRVLGMLRTLNVIRQLYTVRQQLVNSLQPFQTVFPIIGMKRFASYIKRYNSAEGKKILADYGQLRPNGEWYEGKEFRIGPGSGTKWFGRIRHRVAKITEKSWVGLSPESRNQNFTFVAFFIYGKEHLGMSDDQAASHALLRVAQTQFSFTKANTPNLIRGPVGATLFQYKRFMLSSFGLASNIAFARDPVTNKPVSRLERTAMFSRWLGTFLVMGGLKGLPAWFIADYLAQLLFQDDKKTAYDIHAYLRKNLGENGANMVVMGLPAAFGVDISGSIVLGAKPYGRTLADQAAAFAIGPTLSTVKDVYTSMTNKDSMYQNSAVEAALGFYGSSPAAKQIGALVDLISGQSEMRDAQGRLQFNQTVGDKVRALFALRTTQQSMESMEYMKITVMADAVDGILDEIASHLAAGDVVAARQTVIRWNAMFPEVRLSTSMAKLKKDPSISRRVKRKGDDYTLTTRQRRMKQQNDLVAEILIEREGFVADDLE